MYLTTVSSGNEDIPKPASDTLGGMNWKERIKAAREARGINKAQLARLAKVSGATVTDWEGEKVKMIDGANLVRVAYVLGVTPEWIITGNGYTDADSHEVADTVAKFAWVYRNAKEEGRKTLRDAVEFVGKIYVEKERRFTQLDVVTDRRK